jgi:nudix-type nucleoside diphosphatase (YffH/AdpP family)
MSENIKINKTEILSNKRYILKNIEFELKKKDGCWEKQQREVYDHGNAVTVLLYNNEKRTVILTKQFRIASYLNGNKEGTLIEACAGLLEDETPEEAVKREITEETGYELKEVKKIFEAYMTPGAYTELLYFFIAEYESKQKINEGGGLVEEQEEIEILEIDFDKAYKMIQTGEIKDAKTILLLQYARLNNLM